MGNVLQVVSGVILAGGRVFMQQRAPTGSYGLHWETPGGKRNAGETGPAALHRELGEELGIDARVGEELAAFDVLREDKAPYRITFYEAHLRAGQTPRIVSGVAIDERWFAWTELRGLRMTPGNELYRDDLAALLRRRA